MIEVKGLFVTAGNFSLKGIDFTIDSGNSRVIVGPTGSGKTLLLESVAGFRRPDSGSVVISSRDVTELSPDLRNISYVPQDICLFPNMSVLSNIEYPLLMRGASYRGEKARMDSLIDFFDISKLLDRHSANLSGGERQRVALVRALAPNPSLLVLDEPFSAIDQSMREDVRRMIKKMNRDLGITILMVTHDFDEAYFIGDDISVIMNGRIIQSGPAFDMYNYPKNRDLATFLGVRNIFSGKAVEVFEKSLAVSWDGAGAPVTIACGCAGSKFVKGQRIDWGIRSEAVYILRDDSAPDKKPNSFAGTIETIYSRGRMHTAVVKLSGGATVEIDIHDAAARKLDLFSRTEVTISMNPDNIFIIPS